MKSNSEKITLYPSNWLYNAGVVGFLRVLEETEKIDFAFKNDGTVDILYSTPVDKGMIFDKWLKISKDILRIKNVENFNKFFKNDYYPNQTRKSFEDSIDYLFNSKPSITPKRKKVFYNCNFCLSVTSKNKGKFFESGFGNLLGASQKTFPNSYWMLKSSLFVCNKCLFILRCHHIVLPPFSNKDQFFINTPHFALTWDLNKFAENILKREKEYSVRKLLGSSFIEWAIKRRTLLGAWAMMNIEVIIKKRIKTKEGKYEDVIDYFDLPYHITRVLLDPDVASLIKSINEEKIFDLVVRGKFSEIEKANYFVLRSILKLKSNQQISENDPITKYIDNYRNLNRLQEVSNLLPELYAKILKILTQTGG